MGSERNFVCYRACDISEETYEKISTDLTDAELTYCVLCVPSISFACFGDDYSVSYGCGNGYVVFANPKIAEALKAENDRTDWKNTYTICKQIDAGTHFSGINDVAALSE